MIEIRPQIFPLHDGSLKRSYALVEGEVFVAYSFSYLTACAVAEDLNRRFRRIVMPDKSIPVKPLTAAEVIRVETVTKGETLRYDHLADVIRVQKQTG